MKADSRGSDRPDETPAPADGAAIEPAGGPRRLVEIRCGFAESARAEAEAAAARVVEAKRLCDEQIAAARGQREVDPAATQASKDDAHRSFRASVAGAKTRGQVEAAAGAWLGAINQINAESRLARARIRLEHDTADALLSELARLTDIAEGSAETARVAMRACQDARAALAAEAEAAAGAADVAKSAGTKKAAGAGKARKALEAPDAAPPVAVSASGAVAVGPEEAPTTPGAPPSDESRSSDWLVIDIRAPEPQVVVRLMRRDGRTLSILVERLAGTDPAARRRWQLLLSNFVDSVAAAAIEEAYLEFPQASQFWGQFTTAQAREIARGLAALGFHYDGFSAFVDDRVPSHRDLAMAVGSADLLPARVHYWPTPDEAAQLFSGVSASGDTFIASRAPALTLGEMVRLLGRRAELLADLWNEWPQLRPLLFATNL